MEVVPGPAEGGRAGGEGSRIPARRLVAHQAPGAAGQRASNGSVSLAEPAVTREAHPAAAAQQPTASEDQLVRQGALREAPGLLRQSAQLHSSGAAGHRVRSGDAAEQYRASKPEDPFHSLRGAAGLRGHQRADARGALLSRLLSPGEDRASAVDQVPELVVLRGPPAYRPVAFRRPGATALQCGRQSVPNRAGQARPARGVQVQSRRAAAGGLRGDSELSRQSGGAKAEDEARQSEGVLFQRRDDRFGVIQYLRQSACQSANRTDRTDRCPC